MSNVEFHPKPLDLICLDQSPSMRQQKVAKTTELGCDLAP